jgi:transposase
MSAGSRSYESTDLVGRVHPGSAYQREKGTHTCVFKELSLSRPSLVLLSFPCTAALRPPPWAAPLSIHIRLSEQEQEQALAAVLGRHPDGGLFAALPGAGVTTALALLGELGGAVGTC